MNLNLVCVCKSEKHQNGQNWRNWKNGQNQYVVCNVHKSWFKVSSFEREIGGLMDDIDNKLDNLGQYGGKRKKKDKYGQYGQ